MKGDACGERMEGIAVAQALRDTMWGGGEVRLLPDSDDTRRPAVVRAQDANS